MKTHIFVIIGSIFIFSACQKSELPVYGDENYIQFSLSVEDSLTFPFLSYPGEKEFLFPIPVELSGNVLPENTGYKLIVDKKNSTAIEGTHFNMPENTLFRPGQYNDTCRIKLLRTTDLQTHEVRLVLRLEENLNFKIGQADHAVMIIRINDRFSKPDWWNDRVVTYFLGDYSDLKYELFIEVTGVATFAGKNYESELRACALKFKYYLQKEKEAGHTVKEANGKEMEVKVLG